MCNIRYMRDKPSLSIGPSTHSFTIPSYPSKLSLKNSPYSFNAIRTTGCNFRSFFPHPSPDIKSSNPTHAHSVCSSFSSGRYVSHPAISTTNTV